VSRGFYIACGVLGVLFVAVVVVGEYTDNAEKQAEYIALVLLVPAVPSAILGFYRLANRTLADTRSLIEAVVGTFATVMALMVVLTPSIVDALLVIAGTALVLALVVVLGACCGTKPDPSTLHSPALSWTLGLLFVFLVAGGATALELTSDDDAGINQCPDKYVNASVPAGGGKSKSIGPTAVGPTAVGSDGTLDPDPAITFAFGHSSGALVRRQGFRVAAGQRVENQGFQLLSNFAADSGETIPDAMVKGRLGRIAILRSAVRLSLCVDPAPPGRDRLDPGTYTGVVAVGPPSARPQQLAAVPVTVTIADGRKLIGMLAVLIGVIAGIVVRASADLAQAPGAHDDDELGEPERVRLYFFSLRFLVMLAGGLLAGVLVYGPLYGDDPAATADLIDTLIPLAAAAFTATLAAKSIADLRSPTGDERASGLSGPPLTVAEKQARVSRRTR